MAETAGNLVVITKNYINRETERERKPAFLPTTHEGTTDFRPIIKPKKVLIYSLPYFKFFLQQKTTPK